MNIRRKMYSAAIRSAITESKSIEKIAADLELTPGQVRELDDEFVSEYNFFKYMTYAQLHHQKVMVRRLNSKVKAYVEMQKMLYGNVAERAFHMEITGKEAQAFNRIAYLVAQDKYLPKGYRKESKPWRM